MKDYNEDFRFLNKSMLENNLIIFVGAGASMGSNFPSWNKVIEDLAGRLNIDVKNYTDNTIIPQLYYNARGKKDYNETVHELFDKPDAKPNAIHERIISLNPKYVITTNYDTLIEQAFNESGTFLDVIEKDSDLPYAHSDNMIIKMHGGFKYNNFVLKEDDYLNYSNNFKLIENYIKALFARYTVLFVGYSFNDPDTKHIFSWIRSILEEDQQRAYLINITDDYDEQVCNYYSNLGINIIFAKSFPDISDNYTERTTFILDKILKPEYNTLAQLNQIFKEYDRFNYISDKYIQRAFSRFFSCIPMDDDALMIYCSSEERYQCIIQYFENSDPEELEKTRKEYPYIKKALEKSPVKEIKFKRSYLKSGDRVKSIDNKCNSFSMPEFDEFDYSKIKYVLIPSLDDNEDGYFHKAYCYFTLCEYEQCYDLLKRASKYYLSTQQILPYLISENNRIAVGKIFGSQYSTAPAKRKIISEELDRIQNIGIYAKYNHNKCENTLISDLLNFEVIYDNLYQVIEKSKKVDEESCSHYNFYCGTPAVNKIQNIASDFYRHINYNFLLLNAYREVNTLYYTFIDRVFFSVSSKETIQDKADNTYPVTIDKLTEFEIMIILKYLSFKELRTFLSKYSIDRIAVEESVFGYIEKVIKNLLNALDANINKKLLIQVFNKLFVLLAHIELPNSMHDIILKQLNKLLSNFILDIEYPCLGSIVYKQYDMNKQFFSIDDIEQLIKTVCDCYIKSDDALMRTYYSLILKNLIGIYKEINSSATINIDGQKMQLYLLSLPLDRLIKLHSVVDYNYKKLIAEKIKAELEIKKEILIYHNAVLYDVIDPNIDYENWLYEIISKDADKSSHKNSSYCLNLYLANKLIEKDRFVELIKRDKTNAALIDPENYDFDADFEPQMLLNLTPLSLEILKNNSMSYKKIHDKLHEILEKDYDKDVAKLYIKWFS